MDDNRTQAEFPLSGGTVTVMAPTEGQLFALTLVRRPGPDSTGKEKHRFTERVVRLFESLIGDEQWVLVENRMLAGELSPMELMTCIEQILTFDWNGSQDAVPDPAPVKSNPFLVSGG